MPSRSTGSNGSSRSTPAPSSRSPTTATSSTTSRSGSSSSIAVAGIPFEGNYSSLARAEAGAHRPASRRRSTPASGRSPASSNGCASPRAPGRQRARPASVPTRSCWPRRRTPRTRPASSRSRSRPGHVSATQVIEVKDLRKAFGDKLLIDDLTFSLPRAGIVGIIGANGAGKTTLFRMILGQEPADHGSITIGDTVQLSYVDQERDDLAGRQVGVRRDRRRRRVHQGRSARAARPRLRVELQLPRHRPAEGGRGAVRRRAQPGPPRQAAASRAATSCCSTSRRTTSTSTRCGRSRRASSHSPAVPW